MAGNNEELPKLDTDHGGPPVQPRWVPVVGIAIISLVLSVVMSAFMVAVNVGFGSAYGVAVLINAGLGFVVSFPTALVVVPLVVRWQMSQSRP